MAYDSVVRRQRYLSALQIALTTFQTRSTLFKMITSWDELSLISLLDQASTNSTSVNPRNLAVFIDGTSNKPGPENTNVMKLFGQVKSATEGSEPEQHAYYLEGIGVHKVDNSRPLDRVRKEIYSLFEMAFAWNVEKNVKAAYSWLVKSYQEGDRICLFGFSRGAFQVRMLASMIHEIGLVREEPQIDTAYGHYLSIDPCNIRARQVAIMFRKEFCWQGLRVHFVGVWDTVSSLGLVKKDVYTTASATVTNVCHFRHALALDERRVKFMPEYIVELNAYRSNVRSPRTAVSDVKEVWFAGSHSDVGGINRKYDGHFRDDSRSCPIHAGNVPLLWMRREAAANGLVFDPEEFTWDPEDVDLGRRDTMTLLWRVLEVLPVRYQVSFSGAGKHEWRRHWFRPRSVIPGQHIHSSVLSGDVYTPRGTLRCGIDIPTGPQEISAELWTTELLDERVATRLLTSWLSDRQKTLRHLETVLFFLDLYSKTAGGQFQMSIPQWLETSICEQSADAFDKFALTVIYFVVSNFSASEVPMRDARGSLCTMLSSGNGANPGRTFYVLRFLTNHETLRRLFVAHDDVIGALIRALEWTAERPKENSFLLVMDSLRYLINDDDLRDNVISHLSTELDGTESGKTRLFGALEVMEPNQLMASLKMIASLAQYRPHLCRELKPKIIELAEMERNPVGSAAVEVLVALNVPLTCNIRFCNIIGYFGNILPPLDVEVGSTSSPDHAGDLPPVFRIEGSGRHNEEIIRKLILTIESRDTHERTAATLTLLKLCRNSMIRSICPGDKVVDIFMRQLERKKTSLLAAYALETCLELGVVTFLDFRRAARLIVPMLNKGWFDDAVGRAGGFEIFRKLMMIGDLRQHVIGLDMIFALVKKLEGGKRHETRMSLICLDILEGDSPRELQRIVTKSVDDLEVEDKKISKTAVKVLSALAQTAAGERAIEPHLTKIVRMLLSPSSSSRPRSQLFGPAAVLYNLSKNETLREQIKASAEFAMFRDQQRRGADTLPLGP